MRKEITKLLAIGYMTAIVMLLVLGMFVPNAGASIEDDLNTTATTTTGNVQSGGTVAYTITLKNYGSASCTVIATAVGVPAGWSAVFSSGGVYTVPVYNGSNSVSVTLTITASSDSEYYESYDITAKFDDGRGDTDEVVLTTTVGESAGVSLSCADATHTADKGDSQTYVVTVRNTGNTRDTYSLTLTGTTQNWKAHIYSASAGAVILDPDTGEPTTLATADTKSNSNTDLEKGVEDTPTEITEITMNRGETKVVQVCIVSPNNATNGSTDATLLTATSQENSSTSDNIYLNTTIDYSGGLSEHLRVGCADTEKDIDPSQTLSYTITVTNPTTSTIYFAYCIDVYDHSGIKSSNWLYWDLWLSDSSGDNDGDQKIATESNPMSTPVRLTSLASTTVYLYIDAPTSGYAEPSEEIVIIVTAVPTNRADVRSYVETTTLTSGDFTGIEDDEPMGFLPGFGAEMMVIALVGVLMIAIAKNWKRKGSL